MNTFSSYGLALTNTGHPRFSKADDDGLTDFIDGPESIPLGRWTHIAGAYEFGPSNTGRMRVFVDGVEVADMQEDGDGPGGIDYSDDPTRGPIPKTFYFGANHNPSPTGFDFLDDTGGFFNGRLDRLRVHDVAFDGDDVRLDFYAVPEPTTLGLLVFGCLSLLRRR